MFFYVIGRQKTLINVFLLIALFISMPKVFAAQISNYPDANKEAINYLKEYLKINTTNPPGNEKLGAEYLANIFQANDIEAKILETGNNRACLYARIKGTGKKRPIILLNHIDVVPAEAKDWQYPPFAGEIHDGEIWGRGALDMKGFGIAQLEAMLMLKRSGKTIDRDIIFLATPDEEAGADFGAKYFVEHHAELVKDAEFLINEGFFIDSDNKGKARYWGVDVAEKSVLWLKLTALGDAGHASMPLKDSSTNRLVKALNKIIENSPKAMVLPAVNEYFKQISTTVDGPLKQDYENISAAVEKPARYQEILKDKLKSSMLRNTISLTVFKAGYKTNVIPGEASAEIDCRLLPGVKQEDFIAQIKNIIADPAINISVLDWQYAGASPYDTDYFKAIKVVANAESPNTPVVPVIVPWFTDSHWFRDLGIIAYGFQPFRIDAEHLGTMHGKNERIQIDVFLEGIKNTYKVLSKLVN
jgi:acetylornithine deacetylase/succinyl-diaminopimelate desuccinylase-like protein